MQFGITFEKLLLIGLIAALLIGPERLPRYAESVAKLARRAGEFLRDTKSVSYTDLTLPTSDLV